MTRRERRPAWGAAAIALLVLAGQTAPAVAQSATAPDPTATVQKARALIDDGHAAEAVALLAPLAAQGTPDVRLALGVAYYHADDYAHAIEQLSSLAPLFPEQSRQRHEAEQVLGLSLFLAGRFGDAVPLLESTRRWAADTLELDYVLGQAYIQTRQPGQARVAFARIYGVAPDSAAAHLLAAQMMIRLKFETLADSELARAVALDPGLPQLHALIGQQALFRGQLDAAAQEFERELAINPANAMALYQLGDTYVRQARWAEATAALQKSIWINPFYSAPYIVLGKAYLQQDQPATAEGLLRRAIEYDPNNRSAHYLLGQVLQRLGRGDEAKREFETADRLQGQPGR